MDQYIIAAATAELENWLAHPQELGAKPAEIKYVNAFQDEDGIDCMVFKYKVTPSGKWLLGIVSDSGTFSEMQEYHKSTEIADAKEIVNMLKNYWKQKAKEIRL